MNKKKASGLQPIEKPVKSITKNVFKNRNFKENLFFRDWEAIVGASISDYSKPEKLTNNKKLVVLVQSCHALDFEYRMPEIMNSIRTFYGYNPVKKIVIKQTSNNIDTSKIICKESDRKKIESKSLNISKNLVHENDLRNALENLGESISRTENNKT